MIESVGVVEVVPQQLLLRRPLDVPVVAVLADHRHAVLAGHPAPDRLAETDAESQHLDAQLSHHPEETELMDHDQEAQADLNDAEAVARAHRKAIELGEPLSTELKKFCRRNQLAAYPRLVEVHHTLRFIIDLPNREPILR